MFELYLLPKFREYVRQRQGEHRQGTLAAILAVPDKIRQKQRLLDAYNKAYNATVTMSSVPKTSSTAVGAASVAPAIIMPSVQRLGAGIDWTATISSFGANLGKLALAIIAFFMLWWILVNGLFLLAAGPQRLGLWARDRYDDLVLENSTVRAFDRRWQQFRLALDDFMLDMRFNQFWDGVVWYRQTLRQLHDQLIDSLLRYAPWLLVCLLAISVVFTVARKPSYDNSINDLPVEIQARLPVWARTPRKQEGSNYVGQWKPHPVSPDRWVNAIGADESIGIVEVSPSQTITVTMTTTIGDAAETTDFWAPLTGEKHKQMLGDDWFGWCRECKQMHCCEIPY